MPFASQFALELELTRLVPLNLIAEKTYEAAMSLARDLQNSGSDIIIEEDLAEIFGRSRIAMNMASSFRTVVATSNPPSKLCDGISLRTGPGPTIIRALTQPTYFSTVLQCSFLTAIHEKWPLVSVICEHFRSRAEAAPEGAFTRAIPSEDGLRGALQACEEQSAAFDWSAFLLAAGEVLGIKTYGPAPIAEPVLKGLLSMLPLVQHLPEDRLICIQTSDGICAIVVWAFHILGLSVLVRYKDKSTTRDIRFGPCPEQLIIEAGTEHKNGLRDSSISLLSTATRELLFTMTHVHYEERVVGICKTPAQGWGARYLDDVIHFKLGGEVPIPEIPLIAYAFSLCLSKRIRPLAQGESCSSESDISQRNSKSNSGSKKITAYEIPSRKIIAATQLLFDLPSLDKQAVDNYVSMF